MSLLSNTPINLVLIYKQLFCVWLAVVLLLNLKNHYELIDSNLQLLYNRRYKVLNRIQLPQLSAKQLLCSGVFLVISLLLAASGWGWPRLFLLMSLLLYFLYFGQLIVYEDVGRKTHMIPFMLAIFLLAPGIEHTWQQANAYWPIWLAKLVIVQMYVSGAIQKLKNTGVSWANGQVFRQYLIAEDLWHGIDRARKVAEKPWLCQLFASSVLAFQLSIWLILIWPELTLFYAIAGLGFHVGTHIIMRIDYLKYLSCSYLILFIEPLSPWLGNL